MICDELFSSVATLSDLYAFTATAPGEWRRISIRGGAAARNQLPANWRNA
jgi:hypothetical protein